MILLDTNVVSEAVRAEGNLAVMRWLDNQPADTLFLAAPVLGELLLGVELLPPGRRKNSLSEAIRWFIQEHMAGHVLPFDEPAAASFATIIGRARRAGRSVSSVDGQIAAIATTRGLTVATRDTHPFQACGIPVINPWDPAAPTS